MTVNVQKDNVHVHVTVYSAKPSGLTIIEIVL